MTTDTTAFSIPVIKQFLRLLRLHSKAIFNLFDRQIDPFVNLIRLRIVDAGIEVEVQPEDSHVAKAVYAFMTDTFRSITIESSDELPPEFLESLADEIKYALVNDPQFKDRMFFDTDIVELDNWSTMALVDINAKVYSAHHQLSGNQDGIPRSLLDAVSHEYHRDINKFIHQFGREDYAKTLNFQDTVRKGAKQLLKLLGYAGLWDTTFDKLNKISSLNYEGKAIRGHILFTHRDHLVSDEGHPNLDVQMVFSSKIPLSNYRHVRKLLELSRGDIALLSDSEAIYGLGKLRGNYDLEREDLFSLEFTSYYTWELSHGDKKLMRVSHEQVYMPKDKISYDEFYEAARKIFPDIPSGNVRELYILTMKAIDQNRGTLLVVAPDAQHEAKRLKNQCFQVTPIKLSPDIMQSIISIDGAILIDMEGVCHGIGAILDGMASRRGDASRGARYNSAVRYVETIASLEDRKDPMAIVISDDGLVDIITKHEI